MDIEHRRVDDLVGQLAQVLEPLALDVDALGHGALGRERVAAARLAEAADEAVVAGVQEEHLHVVPHPAHLVEHPRGLVQEDALARIHHERQVLELPRAGELGELGQQQHGQVVDAEEAHVLQGADGGGLARAGHARDDDDVLGRSGTHSTSSRRARRVAPSAMARLRRSANSRAE
jgi:hypothetical protein